jgi:hypothetical protein
MVEENPQMNFVCSNMISLIGIYPEKWVYFHLKFVILYTLISSSESIKHNSRCALISVPFYIRMPEHKNVMLPSDGRRGVTIKWRTESTNLLDLKAFLDTHNLCVNCSCF